MSEIVPETEVATTFISHMHYRWPRCVGDQSRSIRQELIVGVKNELLGLASVCEEVADNIEDHLTDG